MAIGPTQVASRTCRLVTLGCKVNQYETQYVKETLEINGYREAADHEPADEYASSIPARSQWKVTPRAGKRSAASIKPTLRPPLW